MVGKDLATECEVLLAKIYALTMKDVYLYITPFFPSATRWQGGFCYDAVEALKKVGEYDVRVIKTGETNDDYEYNGVRVYGLKRIKLPLDCAPFILSWLNGFLLKRKLKKIGVGVRDVAVCHANMDPEYAYAIKKANPKTKALWQTHWMGAPFTLSVYRLGIVKGLTDLLYLYWRKMLESMDVVVLLSQLHVKQFGKAYPEGPLGREIDMREQTLFKKYRAIRPKKTVVFYNGINTEVFRPEVACAGKDQGIQDSFTIGCVANFGPTKGQMTLLKATKRLVDASAIPNLRVRLIGSGPMLETCKAYVAENRLDDVVEFISEVDHLELPKVYRSFNLFVLPTWQEGFCCTLVEAVGCGVPAMSTNAVSFREVISDEDHEKWLIAPQNDTELAQKIGDCFRNRYAFHFNRSMDIKDLWKEFLMRMDR